MLIYTYIRFVLFFCHKVGNKIYVSFFLKLTKLNFKKKPLHIYIDSCNNNKTFTADFFTKTKKENNFPFLLKKKKNFLL